MYQADVVPFPRPGLYLAESEQRSCALAAATSIDNILCKAAGGYLIEQLPDVDEETVAKVQANLSRLVERDGGDKMPTNLLLGGITPLDIAEIILDGLDMQPLQQIMPSFKCKCTEDRLVRSLRLLPRSEIDDILAKEEQVEARCEFCSKVYRMSPDQVREKLDTAVGDPSRDVDI
jgi:molecular chaperone Hsp33